MKPGRNDPCSCGSGKKFKHCCEGKVVSLPQAPSPAELNQLDILFNAGRYAELESRANSLLGLYPNSGLVWEKFGLSLRMQGKYSLPAFQRTAELMSGDAGAHYNLGLVLKSLGQLDGAVDSYRRAVKIKPDFAEAHSNLGNALKDLGQLDDAVASYRRALKIKPDSAETHNNLGTALKDLGQLDGALASYRLAVKIRPNYADAHYNLGNVLKELGQFDGAAESYRRALYLKPDFADAYSNLGNVLRDIGQYEAALENYRRALELKPDSAEAHNNLGAALQELGQFDSAAASYRRALEIKPDYAKAHNNLGAALQDLGQPDEAAASYRRALEINPDYAEAHNNLLFSLNYTAHTPEYCLAEAREYGRRVSKKVISRFSAWQCADQPKRLRVGMVSGDLRNHPVGFFLESLLAQIDPARVELIAYLTGPKADELTARIKPYFAAWEPLYNLSDEAAARLIHADGVHVLMDLSGHTAKNRLPVFAWKPAPVQVSWLGYFATTGVAEMDFLLADAVNVPENLRGHFTETVWYLDTYQCLTPPDVDLPVASLPALQNGYITFGCFQRLDKMGDVVLSAWANIFTALPNARLHLDCKQLGDPAVVKQQVQHLQQHGIDPARVVMRGAAPSREAYLARYSEVDVMLDTFPYPGGTTTCEALWMGVPTLTLAGDTLLARVGASVLTAAGLEDWVATSVADYVDKAVMLTGDLSKLAALRAGLREQALASPVFDAPRFARNLEAALWGMWQARTQGNSLTPAEPERLTASRD